MVVNITEIKVKKRIRLELGDLQPLMDSLKRYGLLSPIVISENYELIAGERRLEAAKALGWENISVIITSAPDKISKLEMEIEENVVRRDFSQEELLGGYATLEKLQNPPLFQRILNSIKSFFSNSFNISENRKKDKMKKNALLSLLLLGGIIIIIIGSIFYHNNYISSILNTFLDISGIILLILGLFYFIKFIFAKRK